MFFREVKLHKNFLIRIVLKVKSEHVLMSSIEVSVHKTSTWIEAAANQATPALREDQLSLREEAKKSECPFLHEHQWEAIIYICRVLCILLGA